MSDVVQKPSVSHPPSGPYGYQVIVDDGDVGRLSLVGLLNTALRFRRMIVAVSGVVVLLGAGLTLALRSYRAESSFSPHVAEEQGSQLAGLAAQFGVRVGGLSSGESIDFYAALLESRALLEQAVETEYHFATDEEGLDSLRGTLLELYKPGGETPRERRVNAVKNLARAITIRKDPDAGMIGLSVKARWPRLAEAVNRRLLELVNDFNLNKRQSQAKAERTFVQARVGEARAKLESAENDLARFLETNREIQAAPRLQAELARFQRRVDLAQQVYVTLTQALERTQLDEVRNTPVITVVDEPEGSARKSGSLLLVIIVSGFFGCVLGVGIAFGREYLSRERIENPDAYDELTTLARATVRDLTLGTRGRDPGLGG